MQNFFEIRSPIATKEFQLHKYNTKFYLSVCAYGDWWEEVYDTVDELTAYLKETWYFTDEQVQEFLNTEEE